MKGRLKVPATHLGLDLVQIEEQVRSMHVMSTRYLLSLGVRFEDQHKNPEARHPRATVRTLAQVSASCAESPIETQVRASQEHNLCTSITSPGSNVSVLRLGVCRASSPHDVFNSFAIQPPSRNDGDDSDTSSRWTTHLDGTVCLTTQVDCSLESTLPKICCR